MYARSMPSSASCFSRYMFSHVQRGALGTTGNCSLNHHVGPVPSATSSTSAPSFIDRACIPNVESRIRT